GPCNCLASSPDGKGIAVATPAAVWVMRQKPDGGEWQTFELERPATDVMTLGWGAGGDRLAVGRKGQVRLWDVGTRKAVGSVSGLRLDAQGVAASPDGTRLATTSGSKSVMLWDLTVGRQLLSLRGPTGVVQAVAFSPDGRRVAAVDSAGGVVLWEAP